MFFRADLGGRQKPMDNSEHPRLPIAMPAPIDGNRFEAQIDGGNMGAGGDACLAQDHGAKQPTEPERMLQDRQFVPGFEGEDRLQYRRQVFGLAQHAAPFL